MSSPVECPKRGARMHENFKALRNWGRDLQEKAIAGAYRNGTPIATDNPAALIARAMQLLVPQVQQHETKLIEHDAAIADLTRALPAPRNPNEYITVKQAIAERSFDPSILPVSGCRWNLAQIAGHRLTEAGTKRGRPVTTRLDGAAVDRLANTYPRAAIYAVLDALL